MMVVRQTLPLIQVHPRSPPFTTQLFSQPGPGSKDSCINSRPLSLRGAVQNMNSNLQTANSTTNALRILSRVAQVTLACTLQSCCSAGSWKCASHCVISSSPAGPEASPSPRESSPRTGLKVGSGYFEPKASLAPS